MIFPKRTNPRNQSATRSAKNSSSAILRPGPFAVDRRALAPVLGWAPGTVDKARKRLEQRGDLKSTGKGKATQLPSGKWKNAPNLYALNRGPNYVPNTTIHPLPLFPPLALGAVLVFRATFSLTVSRRLTWFPSITGGVASCPPKSDGRRKPKCGVSA